MLLSENIIFPACTLTLSYSSEINNVLCPQWVSLPLKKSRDMSSEGCAAHPSGITEPLLIVMAVWCTFLKFELAGQVREPTVDYMYNGLFGALQIL
jgi:hypothetical protein